MKLISPNALEPIEAAEYEARLIFSMLRAPVRIARRARLTARKLQDLVTMAYFQSLRAAGVKLKEIAEIFNLTPRTIANFSQRSKTNFLAPEFEHSLPRRVEFYLWKHPQTLEALHELLSDCEIEDLERAVAALIEQGRAERDPESEAYRLTAKWVDLVDADFKARIDGLNNLSDALGSVVESRFLDSDPQGMARTITFRANPEKLETLRHEMFQLLLKHCILIDEMADPDDESYYLVYAISRVVDDELF
ncbi:MAG: hypothetical protein KC609_00670 [Myxococcales bacterium]|nr:hypothetical protein [Myxococcales bacterium]